MVELALGDRGERSMLVRSMKDHIVRKIQPKDYLGEIIAVRNFVAEKVRYSNDALGVEQVQDPQRMCEEIVRHGNAVGDCDDSATLIATLCRQLGRECEYVVVGFGMPGQFSHVFPRVREPKTRKWIVCDPVAGTGEAGMLKKVTTWKSVRVDK
jgi:transglutaminase-like putative cysteine protease